jgi:hypothetical protein
VPYCASCGTVVTAEAANCPSCGRPQQIITPTRRTESYAIASLVLGLVGITGCPLVASIIAIVFGLQAKARIAADPNLDGHGLASAGVVLGWVGIAFAILGVLAVTKGNIFSYFLP